MNGRHLSMMALGMLVGDRRDGAATRCTCFLFTGMRAASSRSRSRCARLLDEPVCCCGASVSPQPASELDTNTRLRHVRITANFIAFSVPCCGTGSQSCNLHTFPPMPAVCQRAHTEIGSPRTAPGQNTRNAVPSSGTRLHGEPSDSRADALSKELRHRPRLSSRVPTEHPHSATNAALRL